MWQRKLVSRINPNPRHYTLKEMEWRLGEFWLALALMIGLFTATVVPLLFR
jgi:hypothetical protein